MTQKIDTDPAQMFDNMEALYTSGDEYGSGVTDAIAHLGQLVSGDMAPLTMQDVHDELLESDPDGAYTKGYTRMWNRIDQIVMDTLQDLTPNRY